MISALLLAAVGQAPAIQHPEASFERPSFSPDGKRMAVSCLQPDGRQYVWTVGLDGSDPKPLAEGRFPCYSPDGKQVAFANVPEGESETEIFIINSDGTGLTRLTHNETWDMDPTWEPNGKRIAFAGSGDAITIYLVSTDGTGERELVKGSEHRVAQEPTWKPGTDEIIFSSVKDAQTIPSVNEGEEQYLFDLWSVKADGTGAKVILKADKAAGWSLTQPWCSGDGKVLGWVNRREGYPQDIMAAPFAQLSQGRRLGGARYVWSYALNRDGSEVLAVMQENFDRAARPVTHIKGGAAAEITNKG